MTLFDASGDQIASVDLLTARGEVVDKVRARVALRTGVPVAARPIQARRRDALTGELLSEVWGYNSAPATRTVDVHVAWLRPKLEENPRLPQLILTIRGLGYKFAG